MRVVFAGTPAFAVPALEALARAGHELALVLTQPDRPAGRGQRLTPSVVAQAAERLSLPLYKPQTLKAAEPVARLREIGPDVVVVAAYGLILPPGVLGIPRRGCINIHASLLPRWRGAAPIHRAILAGDAVTGISIMQMEAGLDTGPVLLERSLPIAPDDTAGTLGDKLARMGGEAIAEALARIDELPPRPQPTEGVTYAEKVSKAEARIDWARSAAEIDRIVRAFNPTPGAEATVNGLAMKVWESRVAAASELAPGKVQTEAGSLVIGCGQGALEVLILQRPGGRRLGAAEFLRGNPWAQSQGDHVKA